MDEPKSAEEREGKRFDGSWRLVGLEVEGCKANDDQIREIAQAKLKQLIQRENRRLPDETVVGDFVTAFNGKMKCKEKTTAGGADYVFADGEARIDAGKKPPTIDQTTVASGGKKTERRGIYEFADDDTFKPCVSAPDKARPTGFGARADSGSRIYRYERVKKEKE